MLLFPELNATSVADTATVHDAPASAANVIVNGDSRTVLARFPDSHFDCAVTSPPYFGQRDYGSDNQIGCEESIEAYVENLRTVFRQLARTLKPRGSLWLNLGDKFIDGELAGIPWTVALALKRDGWKLRSDIIWHKPNAMPSSVKSRPTCDHEYLFMFVKSDDYHYDGDAIREPHKTFSPDSRMRGGRAHFGVRGGTPEAGKNGGSANLHNGRWDQAFHPLGRNKRSVWSIPLSKYRGAHFAVFPEKLVEPCILAGCPRGGIVVDPFFGAGTTGVVAVKHGRRFAGIELNADYCRMAEARLSA